MDCCTRGTWNRLKLKCTFWNTFIFIIVLTVAWNEYLSYIWARLFWSNLPAKGSIRILFVADPQLQGYHDIYLPSTTLTDIAIWDADSYLSHGYSQAYSYVQPDVVVYMGDLLDEGSGSEDTEFKATVKRFYDIFYTNPNVQNVYIWGDNDVGGEGFDSKTEAKMNRFLEAFQQKNNDKEDPNKSWNFKSVKEVDFIKVDQNWGQTYDAKKEENLKRLVDVSHGKYRILLNHMNLFFNLSPIILQKILKVTKPNIVVSAHTHYSKLIKCMDCYTFDVKSGRGPHKTPYPTKKGQVNVINLHDTKSITEIMVPTCSYRMGVSMMGYGAAVIDEHGRMHYTVLWLPSRHLHFVIYLLAIISLSIMSVIKCILMLAKRNSSRW